MDYSEISWIFLAFLSGGILKGILGVGVPVVMVPILTIYFDIQTAVSTMVIPNLITNLWQSYEYKRFIGSKKILFRFTLAGAIGVMTGTVLLVNLQAAYLLLGLSGVILMFIFFRIHKPNWKLSESASKFLVIPCGLIGGALQGAAGVSAPVSVTFLSAMRLDREIFILIISTYFAGMAIIQIPILYSIGLLNIEIMLYSGFTVPIIFAGMLIGNWVSKYINDNLFETIIIGMLLVMAIRLSYRSLTGA